MLRLMQAATASLQRTSSGLCQRRNEPWHPLTLLRHPPVTRKKSFFFQSITRRVRWKRMQPLRRKQGQTSLIKLSTYISNSTAPIKNPYLIWFSPSIHLKESRKAVLRGSKVRLMLWWMLKESSTFQLRALLARRDSGRWLNLHLSMIHPFSRG